MPITIEPTTMDISTVIIESSTMKMTKVASSTPNISTAIASKNNKDHLSMTKASSTPQSNSHSSALELNTVTHCCIFVVITVIFIII